MGSTASRASSNDSPAKPEAFRLLAPQRGLFGIVRSAKIAGQSERHGPDHRPPSSGELDQGKL